MKKFFFVGAIAAYVSVVLGFFLHKQFIFFSENLDGECKSCISAKRDLEDLASDIKISFIEKNYPSDIWNDSALKGSRGYVIDRDPWGNQYLYSLIEIDGYVCFLVGTFGSDNSFGGSGHQQDIFNVSGCR